MNSLINRGDIWNEELFTSPLKNVLCQVTPLTELSLPCASTDNIVRISLIFLGFEGL